MLELHENNSFVKFLLVDLEDIINSGNKKDFNFLSVMNNERINAIVEHFWRNNFKESDDDILVDDIESPALFEFMFANKIYSEVIDSGVTNVKDECLDPVFVARIPLRPFIMFAVELIRSSAFIDKSKLKRYLLSSDLDL